MLRASGDRKGAERLWPERLGRVTAEPAGGASPAVISPLAGLVVDPGHVPVVERRHGELDVLAAAVGTRCEREALCRATVLVRRCEVHAHRCDRRGVVVLRL